ncbi:MAG: hypothetical protein KAR40_13845 [Candidatus Sabulitectum sp.]|nr:hypothetical protein [Candidatus Sabulitectum sp.]
MGQVKIKNSGAPVVIGGVIANGYGAVTPVDEDALKDYCKAVAGSHVFTNFLTVVDEDYEKKKKAEAAALEAKAVNDVKAKVVGEVEKELNAKIGKKYKAEIEGLNTKISDLNLKVKILTEENMALKEGKVPSEEKAKAETGDDGDFVLDPEKHHIEHRGAGKWFVMDQEEKVHGPLSADDRKKYEEMLK